MRGFKGTVSHLGGAEESGWPQGLSQTRLYPLLALGISPHCVWKAGSQHQGGSEWNGRARLSGRARVRDGSRVSDSPAHSHRTGSQLPSWAHHTCTSRHLAVSHSDYVTGASKTQTALLQSSYRVAGISLVVQWVRTCLSVQVVGAQSLVGELSTHKPRGN